MFSNNARTNFQRKWNV
uniref:Uncharacterized protein n=1 Tax=Moniliophthora roreri TaxID=221103 RepID=A0A0W0GEX0_MONRR